jgi:hypothetical protein
MAKASPLRPAHTSKYMKRPDQIRPPKPAGRRCTAWRNWLSIENLTLLVAAFALAFVSTSYLFSDAHFNREPVDKTEIKALVERIVAIESNGDSNARNKRSSATGVGQFLDDTWLEAVRRHRRDLGSVEIHRELITAAARWMFAAKL